MLGDVRVRVHGLPVFVLRMTVGYGGVVVVFVRMIMSSVGMAMSAMRMVVLFVRLIVVIMRVVMSSMGVAMAMAVASMTKCVHPDKIDNKAKATDSQELSNPLHLTSFD